MGTRNGQPLCAAKMAVKDWSRSKFVDFLSRVFGQKACEIQHNPEPHFFELILTIRYSQFLTQANIRPVGGFV